MISTRRAGEAVVVCTLDRPERRNALDLDALRSLAAALADAAADPATRVFVVTGAGGHFCAGADLGGVDDDDFTDALAQVLAGLRSPQLVSIAAVDGAALGAGTQLAVCCDLRVATAGARFGVPAAKLGLAVDHETVRRLAQLAGDPAARAMLLAAEELGGEAAHRIGFVQRLGDFDDALAWAAQIAGLAPLTIAAHKLALERSPAPADDPDVADARRRAWASDDLAEGLAAFRERRPPRFRGA